MRKVLSQLDGRRIGVVAAVGSFGTKRTFRCHDIPTVCLENLTTPEGDFLCDHLWLVVRKQITALNLSVGDKITFQARSKSYTKGYKGRREDVYVPLSTDYTLSNPTKFKRL